MAHKPRVFVDADVIFAGSASPSSQGASYIVLRMAELTLIECLTSEQAVTEVERNLAEKLPQALPAFRLLAQRCLQVVADPPRDALAAYAGQADPADLPILVAALREGCSYLLTFNTRHFNPSSRELKVQKPGEFLLAVRDWLSLL